MKMTQIPNLRVEDFPSEQTWIGKLFVQLNPMIQELGQILNGRVEYPANLRSVSQSFDISTFQPLSFIWPFSDTPPVCLEIVKATKGNTQTPTILQAAWSYDPTARSVTVSRMVELTATAVTELSGRFQFTVRVTI